MLREQNTMRHIMRLALVAMVLTIASTQSWRAKRREARPILAPLQRRPLAASPGEPPLYWRNAARLYASANTKKRRNVHRHTNPSRIRPGHPGRAGEVDVRQFGVPVAPSNLVEIVPGEDVTIWAGCLKICGLPQLEWRCYRCARSWLLFPNRANRLTRDFQGAGGAGGDVIVRQLLAHPSWSRKKPAPI